MDRVVVVRRWPPTRQEDNPIFELGTAQRLAPLAAVGVAVAAAPWLGSDDGPVLCASRTVFDTACPFCGLTRGVAEIARGDMAASWAMHPFALVLLVQAVLVGVLLAFAPQALVDRLRTRAAPAMGAVTVSAMTVLWVVRLANDTLPPL